MTSTPHVGYNPAASYGYSITNMIGYCFISLQVLKKLIVIVQTATVKCNKCIKAIRLPSWRC